MSADNAEAPWPAEEKKRVEGSAKDGPRAVPVIVVFAFATLFSTGASVAGGLYMYRQAKKTLEETLRTGSRSELAALQYEIEGRVMNPLSLADTAAAAMLGTGGNVSLGGVDPSMWAEYAGPLFAAQLAASPIYCVGVVLLPWDEASADELVYLVMWRDQLVNGSYLWNWAEYNGAAPRQRSEAERAQCEDCTSPVEVWVFDPRSLDVRALKETAPAYAWEAGKFYSTLMGTYNATTDATLRADEGWAPEVAPYADPARVFTPNTRLLGRKFRPPAFWAHDSAGFAAATTYAGWDSVYAAPPAPHPWSGYRGVAFLGQYLLSGWDDLLADFKTKAADEVELMILNTEGKQFARSCSAHESVESLLNGDFDTNACTPDPPARVRDAYTALTALAAQTDETFIFTTATCDGESYYIAQQALPIGNVHLVWMRPKSVVEAEVRQALLFSAVLFSVLVITVDISLAAFEVIFVGMPLRRLAGVVACVSELDTREAYARLERELYGAVRVKEVYDVAQGLLIAVQNLHEYKSYLPDCAQRPLGEAHRASLTTRTTPEDDVASWDTESTGPDTYTDSRGSHSSHTSHGSGQPRRDSTPSHLGERHVLPHLSSDLRPKLTKKSFSLVMLNTRGFHTWLRGCRRPKISALRLLSDVLSVVLTSARAHTGAMDSFSGDRYQISFNSSRVSANHFLCAPACALNVRDVLSTRRISIAAAVVSGEGLLGTVGTSELRSYSILAPELGYATKLLMCAQALNIDVVCSHVLYRRMGYSFETRIVLGVCCALLSSRGRPQPPDQILLTKHPQRYDDAMSTCSQSMSTDGNSMVPIPHEGVDPTALVPEESMEVPEVVVSPPTQVVYHVHELIVKAKHKRDEAKEWMYSFSENEDSVGDNLWDKWARAIIGGDFDEAVAYGMPPLGQETPAYRMLSDALDKRAYTPCDLDRPFNLHGFCTKNDYTDEAELSRVGSILSIGSATTDPVMTVPTLALTPSNPLLAPPTCAPMRIGNRGRCHSMKSLCSQSGSIGDD